MSTGRDRKPRNFLPDNDPLYNLIRNIPRGNGLALSGVQWCLLARRTPRERHLKADKIYAKDVNGLFYYKWGPNEKIKTPRIIISDADLAAAQMVRSDLPKFATGGTRKLAAKGVKNAEDNAEEDALAGDIAEEEVEEVTGGKSEERQDKLSEAKPKKKSKKESQKKGMTRLVDIVWDHTLDNDRLTEYLNDNPITNILETDSSGLIKLHLRDDREYITFTKLKSHIEDFLNTMPAVKNFGKRSQLFLYGVKFQYLELGSDTWEEFLVAFETLDDSMLDAHEIMHRLEYGQYGLVVGLGLMA